jgi:glyoxylase-like metal-dependent hydrolase (beta-lactamase superfamily II)
MFAPLPTLRHSVSLSRRSIRRVALAIAGVAAGTLGLMALGPAPQPHAPAFTFTKVADDVYFAVGTGSLTVFCNAAVIINDNDVLIVDSHVSPDGARALLDELKAITTKPVRYVVNTHYHFDHSFGNQTYGPGVEIIGHQFTREMLAQGASLRGRGYDRYIGSIPASIARLKAQFDTTRDTTARSRLAQNIAAQETLKRQTDTVRATPTTLSFDHEMRLYRGGREIRLYFLGRGHTGGDILVHLPRERVLVSGDVFTPGIPFAGDGFFAEWPETLERIKALDFDVVLPGHGALVRDRERITYLQAYLRDFWSKVSEQYRMGVSADDAARRIDLRSHAAHFPTLTAVGADIDAVRRAYELLATSRP